MRKLLFVITALCLAASAGYGEESSGNFPFSKIERRGGVVRLQLPDHGFRWLIGVNTENRAKLRRSNYSEVVELKTRGILGGDKLYMIEKHQQIVIEPIFQGKALFLKQTVKTDLRSMGGFVKIEKSFIPVPDEGKQLQASLAPEGSLVVKRVIDGDTLELSSGETVRLIGIDCEENEYSPAEAVYLNQGKKWKRAPGSLMHAKASADFARKLVEGKQVRLEYDVQKKDKSGRTLAYVYLLPRQAENHDKTVLEFGRFLDDGYGGPGKSSLVFINATLIKAGYAQGMTSSKDAIPPNVKYQELFVKLEQEARENKRGLWK